MTVQAFDALVLAAGRGPDDPMAKASGARHKCLLPVGGTPMLMRVLAALASSPHINRIFVSIETPGIVEGADGFTELSHKHPIETIQSADKASSSVGEALRSGRMAFPVLVTTADHALLSPAMIEHFCTTSIAAQADVTAGLADADTILSAYPGAARTFLRFSGGRYSGCNLFAFTGPRALAAIDFWQRVERDRKQPWRLIRAFGFAPLLWYLSGRLNLEQAFEKGSQRLGITAKPVIMPMAEAAIDVDKPQDLELVEKILAG